MVCRVAEVRGPIVVKVGHDLAVDFVHGLLAYTRAMRILWTYAHPKEGRAVREEFPHCLELGVGKAAAATTLATELAHQRPEAVILVGVCGAFPGGPEIGELCLVGDDYLADEGVATEDGFLDLSELELGSPGPFEASQELNDWISAALPGLRRVRAATVSSCSGNKTAADAIVARTCAEIETMEGAAVAHACQHHRVPWAQLRAVSNWTGDRSEAAWDLELALSRLHAAVRVCLSDARLRGE